MERKKISVTTAAKAFGVSRKTIQRALDSGRLDWHGPRFGPAAAGLDPDQVKQALTGGRRNVPAHHRAVRNIERAGGDWRAVFGVLFAAAAGGGSVDLDVIACAFSCIARGSQNDLTAFCSVIDGRPASGFGARLGLALNSFVIDAPPIPESVSSAQAWRAIRTVLSGPDAPRSQAAPTFHFDFSGKRRRPPRVTIDLVSFWDAAAGRVWRPGYHDASAETLRARLSRFDDMARLSIRKALAALSAHMPSVAAHRREWPSVSAEISAPLDSPSRSGLDPVHVRALRLAVYILAPPIKRVAGLDLSRFSNAPNTEAASRLPVETVARVMGVSRVSVYRLRPQSKSASRAVRSR